jgi:hypothetical protein
MHKFCEKKNKKFPFQGLPILAFWRTCFLGEFLGDLQMLEPVRTLGVRRREL